MDEMLWGCHTEDLEEALTERHPEQDCDDVEIDCDCREQMIMQLNAAAFTGVR